MNIMKMVVATHWIVEKHIHVLKYTLHHAYAEKYQSARQYVGFRLTLQKEQLQLINLKKLERRKLEQISN